MLISKISSIAYWNRYKQIDLKDRKPDTEPEIGANATKWFVLHKYWFDCRNLTNWL